MHPCQHAKTTPDKPAYIMANSGEVTTYARLEARSNQVAHLMRSLGVGVGDHIAILMENQSRFYEICWGAQRAGIIFTAISTHLGPDDASYILDNCEAKVLITSHRLAELANKVLPNKPARCTKAYMVDGTIDGFESFEDALAGMPQTPIADETAGQDMLYSSGTTGRPKGVLAELEPQPIETTNPLLEVSRKLYEINANTVYLSPAPLYHAAPLRYNMTVMRLGGTCIIMERFDPERFLELIEKYRITHTQTVPTMFVRLLKLPPEARARYDTSSLRCVVHAAAPCPVPVKKQMIDWWGPILWEYYAGTEGNGMTMVNSHDWLTHPGTVGRAAIGQLHICDDDGNELPVGETGTVWFSGGRDFRYHQDDAKTASSHNAKGWSTLGDIGHVDDEGYLYLTDRKAFMIISGGVNIYPQEAENLLVTHPKVADVAVFGLPDEEMGERVHAVVQLMNPAEASPALAEALIAFCREHISHVKCPRTIDFDPALPRLPNGKLYKRGLRERYIQNAH
ncbi:MAG: AMP-binding protein [Burkholderiaceae bacterium]